MSRTLRQRPEFLLGQLAANGDCLYATAVARQIKQDYPDCNLTWAIGSMCRSVIDGNPYVDAVWEIPVTNRAELPAAWENFEREARARKDRGEFDEVFLTQIYPNNYRNFDGTVRASIFRGYPRPITVPVTPVVRLTPQETEHVDRFAQAHRLAGRAHVVLFECASLSGQSFVTVEYACDVARRLVSEVPGACVILSSAKPVTTGADNIIDGSTLTFRENASLTRYCSLFIGCSSGITWLCTSDAATPLPMIQLLKRSAGVYGAVVHDLEYWGLAADHVIEMRDSSPALASACAASVLRDGVKIARATYNEPLEFRLESYYEAMLVLLRRGDIASVVQSMRQLVRRYGLRHELITGLVAELGLVALRLARTGRPGQ